MSYLAPSEFAVKMVDAGESKVFMSTCDTLIRGFMASAILALAAVFAITIAVKTGMFLLGAILFPVGLIMGGEFSIMDYFIWNEIPTVLGNLVGGMAFTGLTLYSTHIKTAPKRALQPLVSKNKAA